MTAKDNKLVKTAQTMTAGVTTSKLEIGATIDIHSYSAKVTHTDDKITTVQYDNLVRRTFETHALNSYLDMGVFPTGTALERPTAVTQRAVIEAVTGDCCYHVRLTSGSDDTPWHEYFTYANFIAWHMDNGVKPLGQLVKELDDYLESEAAARAKTAEYMKAESQSNPYEEDLVAEVDRLRTELRAANQALLNQDTIHNTEILAKNAQIERLEAKAAILTPVCKEYLMRQNMTESDLNKLAKEGWQIQHMQYMTDVDFSGQLWVVFFRDLPAAPAPKLAQPVAEAGLHIGAVPLVPRPPVRQPPMPANQTIIHQPPVSRALTHNGPKPGDTRKVTVPTNDPTLKAAFERGQAIYNRVIAEGQTALTQAACSFNQGA